MTVGEEATVDVATRSGRGGFALPAALLAVVVLLPIALAALTLTAIADRASERDAAATGSLYKADGACRVAAVRVAALDEADRPAAPVTYDVAGETVLVEPAGVDTWTFTSVSGDGGSRITVHATFRWDGASWSLVKYGTIEGVG